MTEENGMLDHLLRGIHPSWWRHCLFYGVAIGKDGTAVAFNREYHQVCVRPLGEPARIVQKGQWGGEGWQEFWRIYSHYDGNAPWQDEDSREVILRQMRDGFGVTPKAILELQHPGGAYHARRERGDA